MKTTYKVGDVYEYIFSFTQEDVEAFAAISGDNNPIHLDEAYAKQTIFKRRIVHGFLGGSVFSKVFGTMFPGEGTIYLEQNMRYRQPMFPYTTYQAVFTILSINKEKKRAEVETNIINPENVVVIAGNAIIQHQVFAE